MAQVKKGMDKPHVISSNTIDGIQFNIRMFAAVANVAVVQADIIPEKISVKIVLQRQDRDELVMYSGNLAVLAHYATLQRNRRKFLYGYDLISPAAVIKASRLRAFKYSFDTSIHLKGEDKMIVTVAMPDSGAWSSAIDDTNSYIEFKETPSVGYEMGVPVLMVNTIEGSSTGDSFNLGEDVTDVVVLNFDKNDYDTPVIASATLSSDYYDRSYNYADLITNHYNLLPHNIDERMGSAIPMAAGSTTGQVFTWNTPYPQSFYIWKGRKHDSLLHAKLELTLNAENVAQSKNYVVYKKLITDGTTVRKAHERADKHQMEDIKRLDKKG